MAGRSDYSGAPDHRVTNGIVVSLVESPQELLFIPTHCWAAPYR